jgi:hypothetical protein
LRLQPVGLGEDVDFGEVAVAVLGWGAGEEGVVGGAELGEVSGWMLGNDDVLKRERRGGEE